MSFNWVNCGSKRFWVLKKKMKWQVLWTYTETIIIKDNNNLMFYRLIDVVHMLKVHNYSNLNVLKIYNIVTGFWPFNFLTLSVPVMNQLRNHIFRAVISVQRPQVLFLQWLLVTLHHHPRANKKWKEKSSHMYYQITGSQVKNIVIVSN